MKKRFAIIILLVLIMSFFGCGEKQKTPETDPPETSATVSGKNMTAFAFTYGAPAYSIEYKVSFSAPATVFIEESKPTDEPFGPVPGYYQGTFDLNEETTSKVMELYDKYELSKWNGFNEKSTATDGGGFELTISFQSGDVLKAKGYMLFPDGYSDFYHELREIFQPYVDQMIAENATEPEEQVSEKDPKESTPDAVNESLPLNITGERIRINVMSSTSELSNVLTKYVETHPGFASKYELSFTTVTTDDGAYETSLDQSLMNNDDYTPNIYLVDEPIVKKYTSGSACMYSCTYEDLGIDVDQKIRDARIAPYIADVTRREGKVVGLSYEDNSCVFVYNRGVAQEVFGDDKPETVEKALGTDWESFFKAAEKCKEKGYAIVSGPEDIWKAVMNSAGQGWVVDGKLYIDPKREAFLDYSKRLVENGYTNETSQWCEDWFADMEEIGLKKVLGFYGPWWFVNYTLMDNCGYQTDENGKILSMGTYGQWGVCRPNVASFWDGKWLIVNKNVLEDEGLKAGVRELIEYVTLDTSVTGLQYKWANDIYFADEFAQNGYQNTDKIAVPSAVVMECSDSKMGILGGQDAFPVFLDTAARVRGGNLTEYDKLINEFWLEMVRDYTNGSCTREAAIDYFKTMVKREFTFITIE